MTPEQFSFWLKGFLDIKQGELLTEQETNKIQQNLEKVFCKITPDRNIRNNNSGSSLKYC